MEANSIWILAIAQAIGQICSSNSMASNLAQCVKLVGRAANAGAKVKSNLLVCLSVVMREEFPFFRVLGPSLGKVMKLGLDRRLTTHWVPPPVIAMTILFLPEASDYIGTSAQESLSLARPVASSPFVTGLQAAAARHSIAVHVGIHVPVTVKPSAPPTTTPPADPVNDASSPSPSIPRSDEDGVSDTPTTTKLYNRTIYITPDGTIHPSGSYDKLHLFDYATLRESASTQAGACLLPPIPSPVGRLGSLICFDLRFPEPALHLTHSHRGDGGGGPAQVLLYPSAFTVPTGRAHWEVLLRARAIETQSYVIAAAQVGPHNVDASSSSPEGGSEKKKKKPRVSYGHSTVIDPWGRVILGMKGVRPDWDGEDSADAVEDGAVGELGVVEINLEEWERVREKMPLIRRTDVYPEI
ncbi:carbon-nitrogen hydrolase [Ustulina deusta]|nr:carbon-nitrogen hydrolase [Ustulina deusta]